MKKFIFSAVIGEHKMLNTRLTCSCICSFIQDLLVQTKNKFFLETGKRLKNALFKMLGVMGPLATYCGEFHNIQINLGQRKFSGDTSTTLLDQLVPLLGQVQNDLNFLRILITESALYDDKYKVNLMIKKDNEIFKASSKTISCKV